jgi:hypothetical protein
MVPVTIFVDGIKKENEGALLQCALVVVVVTDLAAMYLVTSSRHPTPPPKTKQKPAELAIFTPVVGHTTAWDIPPGPTINQNRYVVRNVQ